MARVTQILGYDQIRTLIQTGNLNIAMQDYDSYTMTEKERQSPSYSQLLLERQNKVYNGLLSSIAGGKDLKVLMETKFLTSSPIPRSDNKPYLIDLDGRENPLLTKLYRAWNNFNLKTNLYYVASRRVTTIELDTIITNTSAEAIFMLHIKPRANTERVKSLELISPVVVLLPGDSVSRVNITSHNGYPIVLGLNEIDFDIAISIL